MVKYEKIREECCIDGIDVHISYKSEPEVKLLPSEINNYIARGKHKYPCATLSSIDLDVDGEYVDITYRTESKPFDRVRRITGYLVGTLDRFNDAKRAEVMDRVKHKIPSTCKERTRHEEQ